MADASGSESREGTVEPAGGDWPLAPRGRTVIEVQCPASSAELLADRLFSLGASAVLDSSDSSDSSASDSPTAAAGGSAVLIADLLPRDVTELEHWCTHTFTGQVSIRTLDEDPSWTDDSTRHAGPRRVGPFLVRPSEIAGRGSPTAASDPEGSVAATGSNHTAAPGESEAGAAAAIELVVDNGPAFGSGSHPTTAMCLIALESVIRGGERVLDVGCGSGILAVGALLLGADSAVGVDLDPSAAEVSRRVAAANHVGERFHFLQTDAGRADLAVADDRFDVVVANVLIGSIEKLAPALRRACPPGATMVLSGILTGQRDRALAAIGGSVLSEHDDGTWLALVVRAGPEPMN